MRKDTRIVFKRPEDDTQRKFRTYLAEDEHGNERLRMDIEPNETSTISSLISNIRKRPALNLVKKVHRYTHATAGEMNKIFADAGMDDPAIEAEAEKVYKNCNICVSTGRPAITKKISLSHVNEAFNQETQADFVSIRIQDTVYEVLNIIDTGTSYGERCIAPSRNARTMMNKYESIWLCPHGASKSFSADPEFCQPFFRDYLNGFGTAMKERSARSSHKNGRVERNNGIFKSVVAKISKEQIDAPEDVIVSRASFITNIMHGRSEISAFQLARGYTPAIAGLKASRVSTEMIDAYKESNGKRALQRVLSSRQPELVRKSMLREGDKLWVFYESTNKSIPTKWIEATVIKPEDHFVKCRRSNKGPAIRAAYEHVRVAPVSKLARELMEGSLEEELSHNQPKELKSLEEMETGIEPNEFVEQILHDEDSDEEEDLGFIGMARSMFSSIVKGEQEKDIGNVVTDDTTQPDATLESDEQNIVDDLYDTYGSKQQTRSKFESAPPWLLDKAMKEEFDTNWKGSIEEVMESDVPHSANVISSHVIYKIKSEETGKRMKGRVCAHGNRDRLKKTARKDSQTAQFDVIRMFLSLACILFFRLGCIDVKGAYLQSGPIKRTIYVRPPREMNRPGKVLWKLKKLPYGITEAGRQWAKEIEGWMLEKSGLQRVHGVSQLYVQRDSSSRIKLIFAKVTDDILMAGGKRAMEDFAIQFSKRFTISKIIIDNKISFNGATIMQDDNGTIKMSINDFMSTLKPLPLSKLRRRQDHSKVTESELKEFRSLAGSLLWIGSGTLPQAACISSFMQQSIHYLTVANSVQPNKDLGQLRTYDATITYEKPERGSIPTVCTFSDASFNICQSQNYGQSGVITGLAFGDDSTERIYHAVDWSSSKQKRVSYSSYGAGILECTDADDRGYYIRTALRSFFDNTEVKHELNVDSKGLYDTISTLHEGKEYRLRQTVQRILDSYESEELDSLRWIQGFVNIADALTKRNTVSFDLLNRVLRSGILQLPKHQSFRLRSAEWK